MKSRKKMKWEYFYYILAFANFVCVVSDFRANDYGMFAMNVSVMLLMLVCAISGN
ncbi:hypothetical protein [Fructilactobacillus frigidiflavus]|uniref:hypothetical protein n=1 Tax=Fructilactobacillus frigidiflavus TaxID=3242688 RepID=UPI0037580201